MVCLIAGDVLSGTSSDGVHYSGVMEEWFGQHWWTVRSNILLLTTLLVFVPLVSFKRVGEHRNSLVHKYIYHLIVECVNYYPPYINKYDPSYVVVNQIAVRTVRSSRAVSVLF